MGGPQAKAGVSLAELRHQPEHLAKIWFIRNRYYLSSASMGQPDRLLDGAFHGRVGALINERTVSDQHTSGANLGTASGRPFVLVFSGRPMSHHGTNRTTIDVRNSVANRVRPDIVPSAQFGRD
jgi:hypothetical protein